MFAELFAEWVMGTLKDPAREWFDNLMNGKVASVKTAGTFDAPPEAVKEINNWCCDISVKM